MKHIKNIFRIFIFILSTPINIYSEKLTLDPERDPLEQIINSGIYKNRNSLRLHLGCGESHLKGYVNIDFPPSEHTVQTIQAADVFADLNKLKFPLQTVDEVRSHHVFEHFNRSEALALLCKWNHWLKIGGLLVIETPDFQASINLLLNQNLSYDQKQIVMRHIFGSHEADWAIHCDGWYKEKFEKTLSSLGFDDISFEFTQWKLTHNIIVRAVKRKQLDLQRLQETAKNLLRCFMVDNGDEKMWQVWCKQLDDNIGINS